MAAPSPAAESSSAPPDALDVWLLTGQSNMEGVGLLRDAEPPDPRVWSFSTAGRWQVAEEPLHRLWESYTPVHADIRRAALPEADRNLTDRQLAEREARERTKGAGLGIGFAKAMADHTGRAVGLLPCAHGGVSLDQWSERRKADGGASLYGSMLDRIRRSGSEGRVRGLLWYQGESDSSYHLAATYGQRLARWIAAVRRDLDAPDLPVIVVQIGRLILPGQHPPLTAWDLIRQSLARVPDHVPHAACVTAIDLELSDLVHIDSAGLSRLGRRIARAARALAGETGVSAGPRPGAIAEVPPPSPDVLEFRLDCRGVTGGWTPARHIGGFSVCDQDGRRLADFQLADAMRDPDEPTAIRLRVVGNIAGDRLPLRFAYGLGFDPYCNSVDEADMALPAFLPRPVGDDVS